MEEHLGSQQWSNFSHQHSLHGAASITKIRDRIMGSFREHIRMKPKTGFCSQFNGRSVESFVSSPHPDPCRLGNSWVPTLHGQILLAGSNTCRRQNHRFIPQTQEDLRKRLKTGVLISWPFFDSGTRMRKSVFGRELTGSKKHMHTDMYITEV